VICSGTVTIPGGIDEGRITHGGEKGNSVDEKITKAREFLKLYDKNEDSSQIFEPERSYIKSDKFHLRLKPANQ